MEITTDIALKGSAWNKAINGLGEFFKGRTNYMIYMISLSIGIIYDKRCDQLPYKENEEIRSVPRNVLQNNDNGTLDFMFQSVILSTMTESFSEEERLNIAFGEEVEFRKMDLLTEFANFGVLKLVEQITDNEFETMNNIKVFLENTINGYNFDLNPLEDVLFNE